MEASSNTYDRQLVVWAKIDDGGHRAKSYLGHLDTKDSIVKHVLCLLPVIAIVFVITLSGCGTNRVQVTNTGTDVIAVRTDSDNGKVLLGYNGTGYFDRNAKIHIGDALITAGQRVEVANKGSDVVEIAYQDAAGSGRTMLLGQNGIGCLSTSTPFKIGDACIRISSAE